MRIYSSPVNLDFSSNLFKHAHNVIWQKFWKIGDMDSFHCEEKLRKMNEVFFGWSDFSENIKLIVQQRETFIQLFVTSIFPCLLYKSHEFCFLLHQSFLRKIVRMNRERISEFFSDWKKLFAIFSSIF